MQHQSTRAEPVRVAECELSKYKCVGISAGRYECNEKTQDTAYCMYLTNTTARIATSGAPMVVWFWLYGPASQDNPKTKTSVSTFQIMEKLIELTRRKGNTYEEERTWTIAYVDNEAKTSTGTGHQEQQVTYRTGK